jgi:hypothetical protein
MYPPPPPPEMDAAIANPSPLKTFLGQNMVWERWRRGGFHARLWGNGVLANDPSFLTKVCTF